MLLLLHLLLKVKGRAQPGMTSGPAEGAGWGGDACIGFGVRGGLFKINSCETVGSSCLQGLCLDLGAEAEICFYLCSGSGRAVKKEKWQSSWGQRRPHHY